jgi:hypothetical protein
MESLTQYEMQPLHVLMLSVLVFYLGLYLNLSMANSYIDRKSGL